VSGVRFSHPDLLRIPEPD